ncbi:spermidine synthase [Thiohalocapsa marina]|uniref:Spermidine synthase n=1 Tax=Thiohalocapsa marina TaxID=424902 RepID=A0A5M8FM34_9GAMM|nr:spermidine synthase [Thiohalocapsa marina]KAA6184191.1 spermidine synthase [Thiohalocapsa marina]
MRITQRLVAILTTLLVWGLAGTVFGGLFIGLYQVLSVLGLAGWQPVLLGAVAAAMTTAAFYSAMQLALVGATAGVVASVAYLIVFGPQIELALIAGLAGVAGIVAGAAFAWIGRRNARPLAETLTGLIAGLGAGIVLMVLLQVYPQPIGPLVMAAGVVALVGALFQLNEHWMLQACHGWLPAGLAAPLVAGLIAAVVGAGIWVISGTTIAALDMATRGAVDQVLGDVPYGMLGGLLGGAVTGLVLELLGFRIEERAAD